jgi:tetratricopeptide (TPR) repeat protein
MQRVIDQNFKAFARHRGRKNFILFPIDSKEVTDVIRPETAVFRWALSTKIRLTLSVRVIGAEALLWRRSNVSIEAGYFTDNDLKDVLRGVREQQPDARLQLNIETTANTNNKVFFQLLSKDSEQALQQELANQKEDNELLSHLFRAEIYLRYKLFTEAAEEYEQALTLCPESLELLRATALIEKEAGNLTRSDEIEDSIERLSKD